MISVIIQIYISTVYFYNILTRNYNYSLKIFGSDGIDSKHTFLIRYKTKHYDTKRFKTPRTRAVSNNNDIYYYASSIITEQGDF